MEILEGFFVNDEWGAVVVDRHGWSGCHSKISASFFPIQSAPNIMQPVFGFCFCPEQFHFWISCWFHNNSALFSRWHLPFWTAHAMVLTYCKINSVLRQENLRVERIGNCPLSAEQVAEKRIQNREIRAQLWRLFLIFSKCHCLACPHRRVRATFPDALHLSSLWIRFSIRTNFFSGTGIDFQQGMNEACHWRCLF